MVIRLVRFICNNSQGFGCGELLLYTFVVCNVYTRVLLFVMVFQLSLPFYTSFHHFTVSAAVG